VPSTWPRTSAPPFARDGSLLACGYRAFPGFFTHVGRWTGSGWVPLDPNGQIFSSFPNSIQELPNGEIVVGGELYQPGGGVVRLVGTTWQQLGPGAGVGITVSRLYTLPDGSLLAMGNLPLGPAGLRFRRWDGVQWQPYPTVPADGFTSLVVHPAGDLLLTGTTNGPIEGFARLQSNCRPAAQVVQPGCTGGALPRLVAPVWPRLGTTSVTPRQRAAERRSGGHGFLVRRHPAAPCRLVAECAARLHVAGLARRGGAVVRRWRNLGEHLVDPAAGRVARFAWRIR
jgi:hypothetical protein